MTIEDHHTGCEEYSILSKQYLNYHKYIPNEYIEYHRDLIYSDAYEVIQKFYNFFVERESNKGFRNEAITKTNNTGLWITFDTELKEIDSYHAYFVYDYSIMDDSACDQFFQIVCQSNEPEIIKQIRTDKLEIATEALSVDTSGDTLKYIMLFRPNSNILQYFSELENIDKVKKFINLCYEPFLQGKRVYDLNEIRIPIRPFRIQFDPFDDTKISIEILEGPVPREYYLNGNSYESYLHRKELYFDRMKESGLLTEDEISFCKERSPSWEQFSVKFKWKNGKMYDKKFYNFPVTEFEKIL